MNASDRWHSAVVDWFTVNREEVLIPESALAEICYLLSSRLGPQAELDFIGSIVSGELATVPLKGEDLDRAAQLMREYHDLRIGFVDASIVAIAERLESQQILTTDRRHFAAIRPRHTRSFQLLPQVRPLG